MITIRIMIATGKTKESPNVITMITEEMTILEAGNGKTIKEETIMTSIYPAIMEGVITMIKAGGTTTKTIKTGAVITGTKAMKTGILTGIGARGIMDQIPGITTETEIGGIAHQMKLPHGLEMMRLNGGDAWIK
jgi:hypothetical protein